MKITFQQLKEDISSLHKEFLELSEQKEVNERITINLSVDFKVGWESADQGYAYYDERDCQEEVYAILEKHRDILLGELNDKINALHDKIRQEAKLLDVDAYDYFDAVVENDPKEIARLVYATWS